MFEFIDKYGAFIIEAETEENGKFYQWRKYAKTKRIKKVGGMFANWCEDGTIKFYKSAGERMRTYPQFVESTSKKEIKQ